MKRVLLIYISEFLYWLAFFVFFKALFVLCNHMQSSALTASELFGVFRYGLLMDMSAAGYITALPAMLLAMLPWLPSVTRIIAKIYNMLMLVILTVAGIGDMLTYGDWGVRLNVGMLAYIKDWQGVLMNFAWWQWLFLLILAGVLVAGWFFLHNIILRLWTMQTKPTILRSVCLSFFAVVLTGLLILPIRGGLNTSPMSFSNVCFSEKLYANYAAYNYFWAFMSSVVHYNADELPVRYFDSDVVLQAESTSVDAPEFLSVRHPNVMFVFLESFSQYFVDEGFCPCLQQLEEEGMCWSRCYATGNRSDKGMSAVMAGYPALIRFGSILQHENKLPSLQTLPRLFSDNGYHTAFLYGGDVNFYNTRMFMLQSGVTDITERGDFPLSVSTMQKWGVPDEYLYKQVVGKIKSLQSSQPWFVMSYNISSHPPFDIPSSYRKVTGDDTRSLFCNSLSYADSCLGVFVETLKQTKIWDSTLVVITSDHTAYLPLFGYDIQHPECYRIPLLLTGGAVNLFADYNQVVSQTDIMETLANALHFEHNPSPFSSSLFRVNGFATWYRDECWGYVSDSVAYSCQLDSNVLVFTEGSNSDTAALYEGMSYTQYLLQDFLAR